MNKFLILVVLYNKTLNESDTLKSLLSEEYDFCDSCLVIWDNSSMPHLTESDKVEISQKIKLEYHCNQKNESLSVIYNKMIDEYSDHFSFLILLDHDTKLPLDYFSKIENSSDYMSEKCALMLPQIFSNNQLVSPAKMYFFYGRYLKKATNGYMSTKYVTAINSGMVISMEVFRKNRFRYDTQLNLYGIDDYFMREYSRRFSSIYIIDSVLKHSLDFFSESEPIEKKYRRFKNMINAILYLNKSNIFKYSLCYIYVLLLRCRFYYSHRY